MAIIAPDWAARRDALINWASASWGVPFHWRDDREPYHTGAYGMLHISSIEASGEAGEPYYAAVSPGTAPVAHYSRLVRLRLEVTVRSYTQAPGMCSMDLMQLGVLRSRIPSYTTAIDAVQLSVIRYNAPVTVNPGFVSNGYEYSQTDAEFEISGHDLFADTDVETDVITRITGTVADAAVPDEAVPYDAVKVS